MGFSIYLGKLGDSIIVTQDKPKNIAWVPCNIELSKNRLFDISVVRDNAIERFVEAKKILIKNKYNCNTVDLCNLSEVSVIIFYGVAAELKWLIKAVKSNPHVRLLNIPIEPLIISPMHDERILSFMPFDRIMVWNDNLVKREHPFVKANIGEAVIYPDSIPFLSFKEKKFLVAIYSNKLVKHYSGLYEERVAAFDYFSNKHEGLDLYGVGWNQSTRPSIVASYKGVCEAKKDILQNYKFSICFENATYPGLITEKIFDCFAAGTVPIYYGAPNIQDYIPKDCFIDFRDFNSYEELSTYLLDMKEVEYKKYLDAVKIFIQTQEYYEFTSKRYAEVILKQVQILTNSESQNRTVLGFKLSLFKLVICHPLFFLRNLRKCRGFLFDLVTVW